jgi:hypothetical protein
LGLKALQNNKKEIEYREYYAIIGITLTGKKNGK